MSTTVTSTIRNGVDTATMYGTLDAIKAHPELAKFQFRARNTWFGGGHNRTSIKDFYAAGGEAPAGRRPSSSTPVSRPSCSATTKARTLSSSTCTRWPHV